MKPPGGRRRFILAALLAVVAGAGIAGWRWDRARRKAAARAERARQKSDASADAHYRSRVAVLQFTEALRKELAWHMAAERPRSESERRQRIGELTSRLSAITIDRLPEDLDGPWQEMKQAWQSLAAEPNPSPTMVAQGRAAAEKLNAALAAHGFPDIHF